jgi:phosphocarrier protein
LQKAEKCFEKLLIFDKNTAIIKIIIFILIFEETEMISLKVTINNSVGLHARPATFFVQKANCFKSSIWVEKDDCRVNAKSLLGVLSLGISKDTEITIIADGADEGAAVEGLKALVENELCDKG